jgi:hypothetical protein
MRFWINLIGYQCVWFCTVIGAGMGVAWPAVVAASVFAISQIKTSNHRSREFKLIGVAVLCGVAMDGALAASGTARYAAAWPSATFAPVWILTLWASFALTLTSSMSVLLQRRWLALLLGAIGGPLAYLGAARGWSAIEFPEPLWHALAILSVGWAIALTLLATLATRWSDSAMRPTQLIGGSR